MARAAVIPKSPPKRATRTAAQRKMTATSTTAAAAAKAAPKTTKAKTTTTTATDAKKRGTRAAPRTAARVTQPESDDNTDDEIGVIETKPAKTRGRPAATTRGKKIATPPPPPAPTEMEDEDSEEDELAQVDEPKKRPGRPRVAKGQETKPAAAPKTRGRPKGSTATKATRRTAPPPVDDVSSQGAPREVFINSSVMRSNILRGPAKKKTVTFQVSDSENEESEPEPPVRSRRGRAPGLAAKPARKPAGRPAATPARGRKPAAAKKGAAKPLSPKKATQVAKSLSSYASSDGEDDELSGAKDQYHLVVRSPEKQGSGTTGLSSPVKRINFAPSPPKHVDENGEPNLKPPKSMDFSQSPFMSSPARRPPPSPFNYTFRETPKKGGFSIGSAAKPLDQPELTATIASPLKFSPKKANIETPRRGNLFGGHQQPISQPNFTPGHDSPLKSSPKKGNLAASFSSSQHNTLETMSTPLRRSLFQSPAKKFSSPRKSFMSPRKLPTVEYEESEDELSADPRVDLPSKPAESPLRIEEAGDEEVDDEEAETDIEEAGIVAQEDTQPDDETDDAQATSEHQMPADPEPEVHLDAVDETAKFYDSEGTEDDGQMSEDEAIDGPSDTIVHHVADANDEQAHSDVDDEMVAVGADSHALDVEDLDENMEREEEGASEHDFTEEPLDANADSQGPMEESEEQEDAVDEIHEIHSIPDAQEHADEEQAMRNLNEEIDREMEDDRTLDGSNFLLRPSLFQGLEDVFTDSATQGHGEDRSEDHTIRSNHAEDSFIPPTQDQDSSSSESDFDDEPTLVCEASGQVVAPPVSPYEVQESASPSFQAPAEMPPAPSPPMTGEYRDTLDDMDMTTNTDLSTELDYTGGFDYPQSPTKAQTPRRLGQRRSLLGGPRFTPLAQQLGQWKASSPAKSQPRRPKRGVFSLGPKQSSDVSAAGVLSPAISSSPQNLPEQPSPAGSFKIHEDPTEEPLAAESETPVGSPARADHFPSRSPALSERDEIDCISVVPESPVHPAPTHEESDDEKENDVRPPMTPAKKAINPMQTFHTVSKVPLKAEGQVSPLKVSRKRGLSLSPVHSRPRKSIFMPSPSRKSPRLQRPTTPQRPRQSLSHGQTPNAGSQQRRRSTAPAASPTPVKNTRPAPSPAKTPLRGGTDSYSQVLNGAVVYVNVHTTEGEDASGIFVELLQQMGARCIKSWSWNPSARASTSPDGESETKIGKVGITHVVFKDGGVRTLEKVRQARGLVKCVGVGWVLDCERENRWVEESHYAVDSSIIPRGGAKRRKSMEPRALSNMNGTLVKSNPSSSSSSRKSGAVEDFMRQTPPPSESPDLTPQTRRYESSHAEPDQSYCQTPKTPGSRPYDFNFDAIGMSPATPYYLSQRSRLVQQTCPPKQTHQGLFGTPSRAESDEVEPSWKLKAKLDAARRKSLAFKPRVGSPLVDL
ncbi:hypothetical protein P168DRAFT_307625 [Aspergillus campestris IBT 28561]|uniref:BRCT domain-containing protein n=1 Tax=Aspergillus campestris (strain IBT 28561) TaxID=1392248 RepID=A0A2I1CRR7_ASPC2|nr:uncharacterized protein P168DRAFT_307625 [Aspergillus campestris IBT 28561]PKY00308.1 hypothetical protein P168DRAFT_307625 [Aspergillus campestris IBT 28561]